MASIYLNEEEISRKSGSVYLDDGSSVDFFDEDRKSISSYVPVNIAELKAAKEEEDIMCEVTFEISKSDDEKGLVSGWASVAVNADGSIPLDWQDDIIEPDELENAAVDFMLNYASSGVGHVGDEQGKVVESIVFTKDKQEALGIPEGVVPEGWFITVKLEDKEIFKAVKDGELKMFSIQGSAKRVKM